MTRLSCCANEKKKCKIQLPIPFLVARYAILSLQSKKFAIPLHFTSLLNLHGTYALWVILCVHIKRVSLRKFNFEHIEGTAYTWTHNASKFDALGGRLVRRMRIYATAIFTPCNLINSFKPCWSRCGVYLDPSTPPRGFWWVTFFRPSVINFRKSYSFHRIFDSTWGITYLNFAESSCGHASQDENITSLLMWYASAIQ